MTLYSSPPELLDFEYHVKPTLLVCWWITAFCTTIILLRVAGRFVRSERLFREDKTVSLAVLTLFLRMACVHVILLYGTNNASFEGVSLTDDDLRRKRIASGLVLASRMFYAATLWILKTTILEFFKRLTDVTWDRTYEATLLFIRVTLIATFCGILIADLAECQPFSHYWQVLPDPGGRCRQGYAHLLTMSISNIVTDLLLVFFPVPIILRSKMSPKRKLQLVLLFSLSLAPVGVTIYRVPHIIWAHGSQQLRSLLASVELLFATGAANALVLGSFVRDRGVKKQKFKYGSIANESVDRSWGSRRPTMNRHWGSDEDLVRDLGIGVNPELRETPDSPGFDDHPYFTPAPIASKLQDDMNHWNFPSRKRSGAERSDDSLIPRDQLASSRSNSTITPRKVSFFDVGNLLADEGPGAVGPGVVYGAGPGGHHGITAARDATNGNGSGSGSGSASNSNNGGSPRRNSLPSSSVDPLASPHSIPSPTLPASNVGFRRGSQALLQDLGGLLGPLGPGRSHNNGHHNQQQSPQQHQHQPHQPSPSQQSPPSQHAAHFGSGGGGEAANQGQQHHQHQQGAGHGATELQAMSPPRDREREQAMAYEQERIRRQDRRERHLPPEPVLMDAGGLLRRA